VVMAATMMQAMVKAPRLMRRGVRSMRPRLTGRICEDHERRCDDENNRGARGNLNHWRIMAKIPF